MKFGSVDNPELVDFTLPEDHPDTHKLLQKSAKTLQDVYVGCAKWGKKELKGFYPRGTKDELEYYATQFNSIELNATFYNNYAPSQIEKWLEKTPENFRFFPKVWQQISHRKRLNDFEVFLEEYLSSIRTFGEKTGMVFLQLHDNFGPKNLDRLQSFVDFWPKDIPLAIELRNTAWFADAHTANEVYALFEQHHIANIITDTAGRRDLLHMRLTSPTAFVRFVGANHPSDYGRLDEWNARLKEWHALGLENLYFFVHQNIEEESPLLSAHFIEDLNKNLSLNLQIPKAGESGQTTLF
ncbi:DUF72 domain-containing protein [Marinilongibacter aquaticus]|uniref:DUF72 domain-containing protein n=1 Tax=Marinilongibacter aquaticus TaxID=2975157 RepID=UPI0021BD7F45|nr:DUF72 domain-containing protein [Marinilongibacter aquaticus]UBM59091.1 DUF72 domain-containing protein [Marinilongibacter aquaticus]